MEEARRTSGFNETQWEQSESLNHTLVTKFDKNRELNHLKYQTQGIVQTLKDHELVRKLIPEVSGSLMKAVSDQLFFTCEKEADIQEKCVKLAMNLISSGIFPLKLKGLKNNIDQYKNDPSNSIFDHINLELVSLLYNKRVILYTVSQEFALKAQLFNNRCPKTIQLLLTSGHYDSIYYETNLEAHALCQNIFYEILNQPTLEYGQKTCTEFLNINYEIHLEAMSKGWNFQTIDENALRQPNSEGKRRHKRSMSDSMSAPIGQENQNCEGGYSLFDNNISPGVFDKILSFERRKSIVESIKHKQSFSLTSITQFQSNSMLSPHNSKLKKNSNEVDNNNDDVLHFRSSEFAFEANTPKMRIEPVKNRVVDSASEDDSSDYDDEVDEVVQNVVSTKSQITKEEQSREFQLEDDKLIFEAAASNARRSREISIASQASVRDSSGSILFTQAFSQPFNALECQQLEQQEKAQQIQPLIIVSPIKSDKTAQLLLNNTNDTSSSSSHLSNQRSSSNDRVSSSVSTHQLFPSTNSSNILVLQQAQSSSQTLLPSQQMLSPDNTLLSNGSSLVPPRSTSPSNNSFDGSIVGETTDQKFRGKLKFFNPDKNFGFIVEDTTGQDIFVHYEDLQKAGIPKSLLMDNKFNRPIRFQFQLMEYHGKYDRSRKAINFQLLSDNPPFLPMTHNQHIMGEQFCGYPPQAPPISAYYRPQTLNHQDIQQSMYYQQQPYTQNYLSPQSLINQLPLSPSSPTQPQQFTHQTNGMHYGISQLPYIPVHQQQVPPLYYPQPNSTQTSQLPQQHFYQQQGGQNGGQAGNCQQLPV